MHNAITAREVTWKSGNRSLVSGVSGSGREGKERQTFLKGRAKSKFFLLYYSSLPNYQIRKVDGVQISFPPREKVCLARERSSPETFPLWTKFELESRFEKSHVPAFSVSDRGKNKSRGGSMNVSEARK